MGFTKNKEPVIKGIKEGMWVAAGLSGMGIAIGMEAGRKTVDLIA
jgi:gamma-glutamylputrescine oxidase